MKIEEFTAAGCLQCGSHEFASTGPIEFDGWTEITCSDCGATFDREKVGELDSFTWDQERAVNEGLGREPATVRNQNFVEEFTQNVEEFDKHE